MLHYRRHYRAFGFHDSLLTSCWVLLIVLLLFEWWCLLWVLWLLLLQVSEVLLLYSHLEGKNLVELSVGDQHLVKASQVLCLLIEHTQNVHTVVLDLLNWVSIEGETLQVIEFIQLTNLVQVVEEVSMEVKGLQSCEIQEFWLDVLQVAIGEVKPLEVLWVPHDLVKSLPQSLYRSDWVILQEQGLGLLLHHDLLGLLCLLFFSLASAEWVLLVVQEGDVVLQDQVGDHLTLRCANHDLLWLLLLLVLDLLWFVELGNVLVL